MSHAGFREGGRDQRGGRGAVGGKGTWELGLHKRTVCTSGPFLTVVLCNGDGLLVQTEEDGDFWIVEWRTGTAVEVVVHLVTNSLSFRK